MLVARNTRRGRRWTGTSIQVFDPGLSHQSLALDIVQQRRQLRLFFDEQPPQRGTLGRIRFGREEFAVMFDIQLGNGLVHGGGLHVTGVSVLLILQCSMRTVERTDVFFTVVNGWRKWLND